jgi:hypothetical protein
VPEPRRCERAVDEREEDAVRERRGRRLEALRLREPAVEVRRVRALVLARRVRERVLADLVPRAEWVRLRALAVRPEREDAVRRLLLVLRPPLRVADGRAERELDLRLLVAMV